MRFSTLSGVFALATLCSAQTPEGFTPSVSAPLKVTYGSKEVSPAGMTLTKAGKLENQQKMCAFIASNELEDTGKMPTIGASANMTGTYVLFMIDLDVPGAGAGGARRTLLHAMIQDFKASGDKLTTSATGPTSYMGPSPPAENPPHPHKYVFLLYEQPANFAVPSTQKSVVQSRMGFNIATFAPAAGLKDPIAASYIQVGS